MMKLVAAVILMTLLSANVLAADGEQEKATKAKDDNAVPNKSARPAISTMDLLDMLVSAGVLTRQRADELLQQAVAKKSADRIDKLGKDSSAKEVDTHLVRVPYVPEFIKQQIRDEVRIGLREDVVNDVIGQAEHERWGIPDALPSWVSKGDFRLRYQGDFFPEKNRDPNLAFGFSACQ